VDEEQRFPRCALGLAERFSRNDAIDYNLLTYAGVLPDRKSMSGGKRECVTCTRPDAEHLLLAPPAQVNGQPLSIAVAEHDHADRVPRTVRVESVAEIVKVLHRSPAELHNHVARREPRAG